MILIVCLDDKNGMMFNHRRQSRDRVLVERIRTITSGSTLWMNAYSAKLFPGGVNVDEDFMEKAGEGEYCFVETFAPEIDKAEKVIIYRWNRDYPADVYFTADMSGMELESSFEFEGSSHECITENLFKKAVDNMEKN